MNAYDLLDAIGETDEQFLEESERYSERPRIIRKWAVSAASILLLTSLVLIPIKNGALGCSSASPPDEHTHLFYESLEEFTKGVGRDSLLANLSYEAGEITDYEMECIYYKNGDYMQGYYCTYQISDTRITISFSDSGRKPAEGERMTLHGYEIVITHPDEERTKIYLDTADGLYTITAQNGDHAQVALQVAEDLLTAE